MTKTIQARSHHIYVIELKPSLLNKKQIAEANPHYRYRKDRPLLYVGMTGRSPKLRYKQHCTGYKASRYTRTNCVRLRTELFEHLNPLTYEEAVRKEVSYANELRRQGFAVWQS
mgnify:CR=1 FL=1